HLAKPPPLTLAGASKARRQQCPRAFVISSGENAIIGRETIRYAVFPGREAVREERRAILRRVAPPGRPLRPLRVLARAHRRALLSPLGRLQPEPGRLPDRGFATDQARSARH